MDGISKKIYLELQAPTEDDNRSDQRRIQDWCWKAVQQEVYLLPAHWII